MRLFVVASATILIAAAFPLGSMLTRTLRSQALGEERTSLSQYVDDGVLGPVLVHNNQVVTTHWISATMLRVLRGQPDVVSIKVWRADGTLAWTTLDTSRIGHRFPLDSDLGAAAHPRVARPHDLVHPPPPRAVGRRRISGGPRRS
ncbi:MAG TPA: hypothetical protein VII54_05005 [Gaiellaceae bacterium]